MAQAEPTAQELQTYFDAALDVAKKAGELILTAFKQPSSRVHFKDATDLVTDTDRNCEEVVLSTLKEKFPTHKFVGEESVAAGALSEEVTDEPTWIVDPIDGTTNFVHRFPFSCVSIGLAIGKKVVVGVVYNPMMGEMFTAIRGQGAKLNGEPISISQTTDLKQALVATGFPYQRDDATLDHVLANVKIILQHCRAVRRAGSAALDMCYVARGVFDIYYEAGVHAWDIAAGALIVEEAGGYVKDMYDTPFSLGLRRVACGNRQLIEAATALLKRPATQ